MLRIWVLIGSVLLSACSLLGPATLDQELAARAADTRSEEGRFKKIKQLFDEGERLYGEGNLNEAEIHFNSILELKPEDDSALFRLGNIAFRRGTFAESAGYFERAVKSNPRHQKAHYNLASVRLMQAENHFKYYTALAGKDADLAKVTELLGSIDRFAHGDKQSQGTQTLDKIAGALKK
jgi:tetratricopeptide (TPR) repeat protein